MTLSWSVAATVLLVEERYVPNLRDRQQCVSPVHYTGSNLAVSFSPPILTSKWPYGIDGREMFCVFCYVEDGKWAHWIT